MSAGLERARTEQAFFVSGAMGKLPCPTRKSLRRNRDDVNKTRAIPSAPSALGDVRKASLAGYL
jgi:hypothetical protein